MSNYKEFKIEATHNNHYFRVLVKGWWGNWKSGYVHTNYFSVHYSSLDAAKKSIENYKTRFTHV